MGEIAALLVGSGVAGVLTAAAFGPRTCSVQRSARINAAPEVIFPLINDLRAFNQWNPFVKKDPKITGSYEGPPQGPGAVHRFKGSSKSGEGSIAITGADRASEVRMRLEMKKPMRAQNDIVFRLTPAGGATEVTWAMQGKTPYIGRVLHLLFSFDRMVGRDFEAGLAGLKLLGEQAS